MTINISAPANRRALLGAAALGSCMGLAVGGAYFAGGTAQASVTHARAMLQAQGTGQAAAPGTLDGLAASMRTAPVQLASAEPPRALPSHLFNQASAAIVPVAPFSLRDDAADTGRDLECLTQAVYYEARGESEGGQAAVAQVVLNRTRHPRFPHSVCGVVFQRAGVSCQFSFACDGQVRRPRETPAWRHAEKVAQRALGGFVMADVGAATDFRGGRGSSAPAGLLRVAQIGGHVFYRFGGRLGGPQALTASAEPSRTVIAGFGSPAAAEHLFAASAKVVERAAAAVEAVAGRAIAPPSPADTTPAQPAKVEEVKAVTTSPATPAPAPASTPAS